MSNKYVWVFDFIPDVKPFKMGFINSQQTVAAVERSE